MYIDSQMFWEDAMTAVTAKAVNWTELGLVPDTVIRAGIRRLLESKRREIHSGDVEFAAKSLNRFVEHDEPVACRARS